jgi:hypothetical protein
MFGRNVFALLIVSGALGVAAQPAAAEVTLTINGGRVSLSAKNATIGQILAEWARVGQTKIVNPERVGGGPMTLELTNVSEVEAIEILLRSAGGYLLAPRHGDAPDTSRFDRILILPPSVPVSSAPRGVLARPALQQPQRPVTLPQPGQIGVQPGQPPVPPGDDNDDPAERPNVGPAGAPPVRPPVFNTFPQAAPQRSAPPPPAAPTSSVTAPSGVAVPGMVVPTPTPQTNQPGTIAQPPPPQQ